MKIPDELRCVFSAQIEEEDGEYTLRIPKREVSEGDVRRGTTYRVAILNRTSAPNPPEQETAATPDDSAPDRRQAHPEAPVAVGEQRTVEIEGIGDQGDGVARVDRGYVIIVPDTEKRDRVTIEITDVTANVAFAEVIERKPYYE
ncbi:TRAM domain-containing protein [Haladaptatus pallidirubidus]|uniref:TRAM domain-containing protein n=1 Tax=Haladaptatus pallidirubidus TaxID=1008152 RepID=A0AAV3UJ52_9EURY|nr:TRAM domain-containing protein [Haladaptatus pallidirubidus]